MLAGYYVITAQTTSFNSHLNKFQSHNVYIKKLLC